MNAETKCPIKNALTFPMDREGTLYIDGEIHSTGLFDLNSGLYVLNASTLQNSFDIPAGNAIVLLADDGERIEIERIERCPYGAAHHHFVTE